jgi:hypothetical protein
LADFLMSQKSGGSRRVRYDRSSRKNQETGHDTGMDEALAEARISADLSARIPQNPVL